MDEALSRAMTRNPSLASSLEDVHRAMAVVEQVRATSLPTLGGNVNYAYVQGTGDPGLTRDLWALSATLSVPVVQPRGWMKWSQASRGVDVSKVSFENARRVLAAAVVQTFFAIIAQRDIVAVTIRARDSAEAHRVFAHQRFAGGYGNRVDEVRASQEVATNETRLSSVQVELVRLQEALGVLCGTDHALDVRGAVRLPEPPSDDVAEKVATDNRVDLAASRLRFDLARKVRKESFADFLPQLDVTIQPFWQTKASIILPQQGWQALAVLTVPLYDGGLRYGLLKDRRAQEIQARLAVENLERQVASDVRVAQEGVRRASAAWEAARRAAGLASETLDLASQGYKAGASSNLEVIDAERTALDAATAVALADNAKNMAELELLLATGRFPERLSEPPK